MQIGKKEEDKMKETKKPSEIQLNGKKTERI